MIFPRSLIQPVALIASLVVALVAMRSCRAAHQEASSSLDSLKVARQVNDSTDAQLASTKLRASQYEGLLKEAKALNGKLVAAATIRVPARDTLIVHDTLETRVLSDSTRIATFRDSTFAGTVSGTVVAPPCCQPLRLDSLRIHRPAFSPSVGFVQVGSRTVAVVVWQGERDSVQVDNPFATLPAPQRRLVPYMALTTDPSKTLTLEGGAGFRLGWGLEATAALVQRLDTSGTRVQAGLRKEW